MNFERIEEKHVLQILISMLIMKYLFKMLVYGYAGNIFAHSTYFCSNVKFNSNIYITYIQQTVASFINYDMSKVFHRT